MIAEIWNKVKPQLALATGQFPIYALTRDFEATTRQTNLAQAHLPP
jgi:hypothetical protein